MPALTVNDLDRRQGGRRPPRCRSASATRSPDSPSPTGRSGCWPRTTRKLAGSSEPGGAETSNPKTFDFGPLKPGATRERGLEAERGQGRPATPALRVDAGLSGEAKAETAGGVAPGGSFAVRDHRRDAGHRSHRQRRSRRNRAKPGQSPASSVRGMRRRACAASSLPRSWRWPRCPPAAPRLSERRAAPSRAAGPRGVGAEEDRQLRSPVYVTGAPGFPKLLFVVEQPGRVAVLRGGHRLGRALPRHPRPGRLRRRARPALDRLPARLRAERPLLRLLHGQRRQHPHRRIQARAAPTRAARGSRRTGDRDPPPGQRQPQRRPAAVPRRPPLLRHRRRRLRRRPAEQRPEQGRACSASCCGSTRARAAGSPTRSPPTTRSSASPAATRSTATACATRSASPSTRSPPGSRGSRSATSARTGSRSSTTRPSPAAGGANFGWDALRGLRPLHGRKQRHARPRRHDQADLRLPPQPRRQLLDHRRLRGPRPRPAARSTGATSTPTSARASCAASSPTCSGASGDRKLGLAVASPELLRRRRPRPRLRRLARRPGLPARPALRS